MATPINLSNAWLWRSPISPARDQSTLHGLTPAEEVSLFADLWRHLRRRSGRPVKNDLRVSDERALSRHLRCVPSLLPVWQAYISEERREQVNMALLMMSFTPAAGLQSPVDADSLRTRLADGRWITEYGPSPILTVCAGVAGLEYVFDHLGRLENPPEGLKEAVTQALRDAHIWFKLTSEGEQGRLNGLIQNRR